jgi:plasmid stabilization system protein ParE
MRLAYHPAVQKDVNGILAYYEGVSTELADEFWKELGLIIELISANPQRGHPVRPGLLRVNLRRFPYHVLFRRLPLCIRIIVVRHNKRHPKAGMSRR